MDDFRISVPKPCNEAWEKMTLEQTGKFCGSCSKSVVDFTRMVPEEVQHYFLHHKGERTCGRFRKAQLEFIDIQIPERVLYKRRTFRKAFLLALFIVMGNTLFSCSNDRTMGEVAVVDDHQFSPSYPGRVLFINRGIFPEHQVVMGISCPDIPFEEVPQPPPPPPAPRIEEIKFVGPKTATSKHPVGGKVVRPIDSIQK
ncbi:MAG: hypothetical protein CFE23_06495 [Flavobacterium sp. BFFFF1]|uniref:hypothetical protein n=1 Tax=Flavobacterium sp. BFFFF1 TaxID=2015557 RepID=UPI000BCFDC0E|nr:hypothetical protein [Flavobacterium sp. BFFFF1]OYU81134.1 MAG: hypothetical protein CFE23_06495 [Flavobacterium sp. BFFFF1]